MSEQEADKTTSVIKRRKSITLQTKYDIITDHAAGISITALSSKYSIGKSTICTIIKDKQKYLKEITRALRPLHSTRIRGRDSSLIPHLEHILSAWIADQTQRLNIPLTQNAICTKALSIFNTLKDKYEGECKEKFVASNGWFYRYKNRVGLHNVQIQGEPGNLDHEAVRLFPKELDDIVETFHYTPSLTDIIHEQNRNFTNEEEPFISENHRESVEKESSVETPLFTLKKLEEAFANVKNACDIFESQDSNLERSAKVTADLNKSIICYREIYNEMKKSVCKQETVDKFS